MEKRIYYKVLTDGDGEVSNELSTLAEARKEKASIIKEDKSEFGWEKDECVHYSIVKYTEIDGTCYEEDID